MRGVNVQIDTVCQSRGNQSNRQTIFVAQFHQQAAFHVLLVCFLNITVPFPGIEIIDCEQWQLAAIHVVKQALTDPGLAWFVERML